MTHVLLLPPHPSVVFWARQKPLPHLLADVPHNLAHRLAAPFALYHDGAAGVSAVRDGRDERDFACV